MLCKCALLQPCDTSVMFLIRQLDVLHDARNVLQMSKEDNKQFNPLMTVVEDALAADAPIKMPKDFDFSQLLPG